MTALIISALVGATALFMTNDTPQPAPRGQKPATVAQAPAGSAPRQSVTPIDTEGAASSAPVETPARMENTRTASGAHADGKNTAGKNTDGKTVEWRTAPSIAPIHANPAARSAPDAPTTLPDRGPISGIRILELTGEELARLNVTVRGNEIQTFSEETYVIDDPRKAQALHAMGYDTTKPSVNVRMRVTAGPRAISNGPLPYNGVDTVSKVVPIIVSSDWVKHTLKQKSEGTSVAYFDRSPLLALFGMTAKDISTNLFRDSTTAVEFRSLDERNAMLANRLIPIRVPMKWIEKETNEAGEGECMLWYFPTDEFVAALPDRYRIPLRKELDLLADVEEHKLEPGAICERLTGETFFDYCRKSSGAMGMIAAYPNPSRGDLTCRYTLTEERTISFALYDLAGRHLRDLTEARRTGPGTHEVKLSLEGVRSGNYLIGLMSEKGEQVIQRVIME